MKILQRLIESGLVPYIFIAAGLVATMAVFYTLKKDHRRQQQRGREQYKLLEDAYLRLENKLDALKESIQDAQERTKGLVPPPSARSGLNLNKRAQAARMFRRGEKPEQIAAALTLPQNEVTLLLKVHQAIAPN